MTEILRKFNKNRNGMVLIITIIVLVVLSTMVYTLSSKISQRLRRDQYLIDYQTARYACDSALKYSLAVIAELKPQYIDRVNEPDFSDLYRMTQEQYNALIEQWQKEQGLYDYNEPNDFNDINDFNDMNMFGFSDSNMMSMSDSAKTAEKTNAPKKLKMLSFAELMDLAMKTNLPEVNKTDSNDVNSMSMDDTNGFGEMPDFFSMFASDDGQEKEKFYVKGPYGPKWPMVKPKVDFEFSSAEVEIEIEDENAKMPLAWAVMNDEKYNKQAQAAVKSFLEWMAMSVSEIEEFDKEAKIAEEIKNYSTEMKPIVITKTSTQQVAQKPQKAASKRRSRRTKKTATQPQTRQVTQNSQRDMLLHYTDFSKIFNSNVIDKDLLKRAAIQTEDRIENAYKYISFFSADKVNINSAPRHILEAAFTFGGDEVEIADLIIDKRKEKPFKDIEELEKELSAYRDSIEKSKPFITTQSNIFMIKVKTHSGIATAQASAAVLKDGNKVDTIAIITE